MKLITENSLEAKCGYESPVLELLSPVKTIRLYFNITNASILFRIETDSNNFDD